MKKHIICSLLLAVFFCQAVGFTKIEDSENLRYEPVMTQDANEGITEIEKRFNCPINDIKLTADDILKAYEKTGGDIELLFNELVAINKSRMRLRIDVFGIELTQSELMLLFFHREQSLTAFSMAKDASSKTIEIYGHETDGTIANAFKHAFWNALMTCYIRDDSYNNQTSIEYGVNMAKRFADAHEDRPDNPPLHMGMDLYNNDIGRQIGASYGVYANPEILANKVKEAVIAGQMKYIIFNYEYLNIIEIKSMGGGMYQQNNIYGYADFIAYTNMSHPDPYSLPPFSINDASRGKWAIEMPFPYNQIILNRVELDTK